MQARMWQEAPHGNAADFMDPEDFGYTRCQNTGMLMPMFFEGPQKPLDICDPCKCKNCVKKTCICRVNGLPCNAYCHCYQNECKNPKTLN